MSLILIVDDEQAVCWALQRALTRAGHKVEVAASAEEAFRHVDKHRPDAIFLDVRLPGMDGLTALGELSARTDDTPIIIATAFGNLTTAVRAGSTWRRPTTVVSKSSPTRVSSLRPSRSGAQRAVDEPSWAYVYRLRTPHFLRSQLSCTS